MHEALNLLKVVSHQSWGADRATKLKLYRSLIRSKLDYGAIVYGNTKESILRPLKTVQNTALRLCLGAFCTSPVVSLEVEAGEIPIHLRREQLSLLYMLKLKSLSNNPAHDTLFEQDPTIFQGTSTIPPISVTLLPTLEQLAVNFDEIAPVKLTRRPPAMLRGINTNVELTAYSKSDTPPAHFVALFHEMVAKYFSDTVHIYTDGSKMDTKSGSAIVFPGQPDQSASFRLPDNTSIFTAKGFALSVCPWENRGNLTT